MTTAAPTTPDPEKTFETWEMTTPGRVWLQTTTFTRHGQPMLKDVSLGPNKVGAKLKISVADREMNQEKCAAPEGDPFRDGTLVRIDADQNSDPATESKEAISAKDLLAIFSKNGNAFQAAVRGLGEIPVRRMREMAEAVDASAKQVEFLDSTIEERFTTRRSQEDAVFDLSGERRRDLEK